MQRGAQEQNVAHPAFETGRAREVLGGDDTDSDGDEAPRAEEEAAEGAAGEAAEEVKAEPAPALEPAIKLALRQRTPAVKTAVMRAVGEAARCLGEGRRQ